MRRQGVWIVWALFLCCFIICPAVRAAESEFFTYEELVELGKEEFSKDRYQSAIEYFQRAYALDASSDKPIRFIQLIKRVRDGRVAFLELDEDNQLHITAPQLHTQFPKTVKQFPIRSEIVLTRGEKSKEKIKTIIEYLIEESDHRRVAYIELVEPVIQARLKERPAKTASWEAEPIVVQAPDKQKPSPETVKVRETPKRTTVQRVAPKPKASYSTSTLDVLDEKYLLRLDDEMWNRQPNTLLEIELDKALVLQGSNIDRYLVLYEGFYNVEKLDKDRIVLRPIKRGRSLLHIWDDRGRWTFNVEVVTPILIEKVDLREANPLEEKVEPFKFAYSNDWSTFYTGDSLTNLKRQNLNFRQWMEVYGPTPYGYLDSHVIFTKFDASTEVTGYGVGLSNAKIGNFEDFSVRGFDTSKAFSELSLPGKYFRGVLLDAKAFNHTIGYTYLRGLERTTFGFVSPGVVDEVDSYIEGGRLTLFPDKDNQYSFNFARGFGEARSSSLKERVFSLETKRRIKDFKIATEVAYDDDVFARTVKTNYKKGDVTLDVNFRDIDKDFTTISGTPAGSGEIGGLINLNWAPARFEWNANLDVYRERDVLEAPEPDRFNFDAATSLNIPLYGDARLRTDVYYIDTPGLASQRRDLRINTNYSQSFRLSDFYRVFAFVGSSYQRSRFSGGAANEYDRTRLSAGLRFPIIPNLAYFANYDYSVVEEVATGEQSYPSVLSTGVSYARQLTDSLSTDIGFTYRNEENTQDNFSFLAGEDSITGSVGLRFRPVEDFEFFIDGRVRNVWAEAVDGPNFNDVDIRAGVRTAWDTLFRWNPTGYVQGFVFKDDNANNRFDTNEQGLEGIVVRVGDSDVTTDKYGRYSKKVKAKKVKVSLAIDSLPEGFIPSGVLEEDLRIVHKEVGEVSFGLSVRSGIYGVVYFDKNDNNRLDSEDEFVSRARITLDVSDETFTDYEGVYFFGNIDPGKHVIRLDINSLPKEYLPKIKVQTEIEVAEGATYIFHVPLRK